MLLDLTGTPVTMDKLADWFVTACECIILGSVMTAVLDSFGRKGKDKNGK